MDNQFKKDNDYQQPLTQVATYPEFAFIDKMASLLDNRFRIPFTQVHFGVDFLIGLIPTVGDWLGFGISSVLVLAMMRRGIGIGMLLKMMGNIILDAIVGSIPILGDLFDLHYKSNRRNVAMLKEYYIENPNPPAASRSFFVLAIMFLAILGCFLFLVFKTLIWLWGALFAYFHLFHF